MSRLFVDIDHESHAVLPRLQLEETDKSIELDIDDEFDLDVAALFVYWGRAEPEAERAVRAACEALRCADIAGRYIELYADPATAGPFGYDASRPRNVTARRSRAGPDP